MKLIDLANSDAKAIVDDEDFERLQGYTWRRLPVRSNGCGGYVLHLRKMHERPRNLYLHRFLCGAIEAGMVVDHLNGDVLDNRRSNLRVTTYHVNHINIRRHRQNRTAPGIRGVSFAPRRDGDPKPWYAQIQAHYKTKNLGRFATLEEAAAVRVAAESKYFSEPCPLIEVPACQ